MNYLIWFIIGTLELHETIFTGVVLHRNMARWQIYRKKYTITSLIMGIKNWSWCPSICFLGLGSQLYNHILQLVHFYNMKCVYRSNNHKCHARNTAWPTNLPLKYTIASLIIIIKSWYLCPNNIFSSPRKWIHSIWFIIGTFVWHKTLFTGVLLRGNMSRWQSYRKNT